MENFNALLTLSELKTLYSGKPVGICPLYKGTIGATKTFEATGNPITIPEYKELVKLTTKFSPKQAGTGDPSLENVRPISGWDSIKVTVSNESESHDYDITLPETIYGGTVDAVTGVGEKTIGRIVYDGSTYKATNVLSEYGGTVIISNIPIPNSADANASTFYACDRFTRATSPGAREVNKFYINPGPTIAMIIQNGLVTDVDSANNWLAENPIPLIYQLATPEPFEFSQISIPSLGGENKFFTNGENMDIIYNETSFWG